MAGERPRYGLLISALGAIVLAVSVFLPWYGVSFTAAGLTLAQQVGDQAAAQFGNAALQSYMSMSSFHANLSSLAGHQFMALSAHQALKDLNVVLLILAGLAIAVALIALAGPASASSSSDGHRAPLLLLGAVAAVCVLYRMVDPPSVEGNFLALSLREGAWLALLGSIAMMAGALWPSSAVPSDAQLQRVWSELSGWTPEA